MNMDSRNSEESRAIARIALRKALKQIPTTQSDAYLYVEVLGFTTIEAGRILGVDQSVVSRRVIAAKSSLKIILSSAA